MLGGRKQEGREVSKSWGKGRLHWSQNQPQTKRQVRLASF